MEAIPDLSPLEKLSQIYLPPLVSGGDLPSHALQFVNTREIIVLARRRFYFGGARRAIYTLFCIKKYTNVMDAMNRNVMLIIARMLYDSRLDPVWQRADKYIFDMDHFHCPWPPRFETAWGPSVFSCACGFHFVEHPDLLFKDGRVDEKLAWEVYSRRAAHFKEMYNATTHAHSNWDSKSYPLCRCVQQVLLARKNVKQRTPDLVDAVISRLSTKTGGRVMRSNVLQIRNADDYDPGWLFERDIQGDVCACIDDFLENIRNAGAPEPHSAGKLNRLFSYRLQREYEKKQNGGK